MPNAKILLELPGVEAGSKECGKCRWREWEWHMSRHYCIHFLVTEGESKVCVRLEGEFPHPLRCPACLAAEEAAPSGRRRRRHDREG
jgi:hypothetical protein